LLEHDVDLERRDLENRRLSETELDALIGDRDYLQFLNSRNELYRSKNMKEKPPSRSQAIAMMAKVPNLIRRPVVIRGHQLVLGFDEAEFKKLLS
jgi:arsenate reductase-like glutaredoxin family protein